MRQRQRRLLSVEEPLALKLAGDFSWAGPEASVIGPIAARAAFAAADVGLTKPAELTWWDWTVFLLHTAAEIEHALMVQYLYAAYSLAERNFQGPQVPPNAEQLAGRWRRIVAGIAREEMGHLVTVQNLLRFIGGSLNFEREDFPFLTLLYPFPFQLEPLTKNSLAKYVAAEMPDHPAQPEDLMREVMRRAKSEAGGSSVNRVGPLYAELAAILRDPARLPDDCFRPETADIFQARHSEWMGSSILLVREVRSRNDAVAAIVAIGEQGEGPWSPGPSGALSHFDRFLGTYKEFPETDAAAAPVQWVPTRPVARHPNTLAWPSSDPALEGGRITCPLARLWAQLFNVRYRMLLLDLVHALYLEGPMDGGSARTPRGHLRDWAFLEMRGRMLAGLRGISGRLVQLPLKDGGDAGVAAAGPPFELPYTLAVPDREKDRWRLHLALLNGAAELIREIESTAGEDDLLREMKAIDVERRLVIRGQL